MPVPGPVAGALAGFVATAPMTVAMEAMHRYLPWAERYPLPPSQIADKAEHKGLDKSLPQEQHLAATLALHFGFGGLAGGLYGLFARLVTWPFYIKGLLFGLLIWAGSYMGWLPATRILPPAQHQPAGRNLLMIVAHLIWGVITAWLFERVQKDSE